jgi:predicted kinase
LDQLIESGCLRPADIERLAAMLVKFYSEAPPLLLEPQRHRTEIERHVRANQAELLAAQHGLPAAMVRRVHTAQLLFLTVQREAIDARVCDGRVVDGHGDLRPEHVCLGQVPVVFDCLEFSPELRRIDVLDELGFFAMECDFLGAGFVGCRVLDAYLRVSGDAPPELLLPFYQSYRACVRAKVAVLRAKQLGGAAAQAMRENARRYLELADQYARRLAEPFVIVTRGLSGSGKTTLASRLGESLGVSRIGTDDLRSEAVAPSPEPVEYGQGRYRPAARAAVYDELLRRAGLMLARGESVVLDGTFLSAQRLRRVADLAQTHGARCLVLTCHCSAETAVARIAERQAKGQDKSEARPVHRREQEAELEAVPSDMSAVEVDTSGALNDDVIAQSLRPLLRQDEEGRSASRGGSAMPVCGSASSAL